MFAAVLLRRDRALTAIAVALDIAFHAGRGGALAGAAEVADTVLAVGRDRDRQVDHLLVVVGELREALRAEAARLQLLVPALAGRA